MPEPETVAIAHQPKGGYKDTYHTQPDCHKLRQAPNVRTLPTDHVIIESRRECRFCSGDYTPNQNTGTQLATILRHMDPDDLGGKA